MRKVMQSLLILTLACVLRTSSSPAQTVKSGGVSTMAEQEGPQCNLCYGDGNGGGGITGGNGGGGMHQFTTGTACTWTTDCYDCHAFNACHTNSQSGTCTANHWTCGVNQAFVGELREAAGRKDGGVALLRVAHGRKGIEVRGAYVIVRNCRGEVGAAFKLNGIRPVSRKSAVS